MAAYAAVVSVMNIIDQIQNHRRHSFSFDNNQMESLREIVDFLLDFIESCSDGGSKAAEALESQIASAAYATEDVIESHIVDQIHAGSTLTGETSSCFLVNLQKVIEDMDSIKKLAMEVKVQWEFRYQLTTYSRPATSSGPLTYENNVMVRYDDELIQLMERLTRQQANRQIIPIVGMGGIGKTTLARNVYERSVIVQYFDVLLWTTVSQEYSAEKILLQLLSCQLKPASGTVHELGEHLHKTLSGRRYLVVLDDMWSMDAWDEIQPFLPNNGNGSSIIITTRLSTMAIHLGSNSFVMKFLDEKTSWKLFCEKAFGEEGCPHQLMEIGKNIVENCKGLPLSIVVIGGHLRKSSRTKEYWEVVANDINSILTSGDDEQCLNILSLSYSYLPVYLKPCFLHMGIYPEDEEVFVAELIKLWVAEGFLKPNKVQSFEEVAEGYLRDLIERNLILVSRRSHTGEIDTCIIHDLVRQMCLRVVEKEKFFCVLSNDIRRALHIERRIVVHEDHPSEERHPEIFHTLRSAQLVRSLNWKRGKLSFDLRLLRVLNRVGEDDGAFDYFQQVNLRYLDSYCSRNRSSKINIPSSISRLWNLQTLKITGFHGRFILPSEFWEMPQLRNVDLPQFYLPNFPFPSDSLEMLKTVLPNLQTLSKVKNFRMSEEVCKRIPNIKKLIVRYYDFPNEGEASSYYFSHNLVRFHKLESLHLNFSYEVIRRARDFTKSFMFPSSLRELYLGGCCLHWEDLTMLGSLPCLFVLRLELGSVKGPEWNPIEGEFPRLKSLYISCCNLIHWNADSAHFPVLEHLELEGLYGLEEIPSGIGEIPTLGFIELWDCSVSAAVSAMEILVEQESLGNEGLQLKIGFYKEEEHKNFKEKLEQKGLTSEAEKQKWNDFE